MVVWLFADFPDVDTTSGNASKPNGRMEDSGFIRRKRGSGQVRRRDRVRQSKAGALGRTEH